MTIFKHADDSGDTLQFSGNSHGVLIESDPYVSIPNADVPTVALELLKAAGQEVTILPKTTKPVVERPHNQVRCGVSVTNAETDPTELREWAAGMVAIAEYIENKAQRETEVEKKLQERRDALAERFTGNEGALYGQCLYGTKQAIDAYIALEDRLASRD